MQNKILTFVLLTFFTVCVLSSRAQQAPIFTHHSNSNAYVNPGFAGLSEGILLNGISRMQWSGFKDDEGNQVAPTTYLLTADMPIRLLRGGIGLAIVSDQIGFEDNIGVQLGYSYHWNLGGGILGIGAAINFLNRSVDFSKYKPTQDGDPALPTGEESDMLFDANLGLFWQVPELYYVGFSVTSLLETKGKALTSNATSSSSFVGDRTFYFVAGYQFEFPNKPEFEIIPSFNVMSNLASTQFNLSAKVLYNKKFWGGVNYRLQESIGVMIGFSIKDIQVGYAYDINTLGLGLPGSHEIFLSYCFKIQRDKLPRIYRNTRYL